MLAPHINRGDKVILFDGICKLCAVWARFIIKYDRDRVFKLATVQSQEGKAILEFYNLPTRAFETMVFIDSEDCYLKSTAFLEVMKYFAYPWRVLRIFKIFPTRVRDWFYDRIALNRYKVFGKYDECLVPSSEHESRFLSEKLDTSK